MSNWNRYATRYQTDVPVRGYWRRTWRKLTGQPLTERKTIEFSCFATGPVRLEVLDDAEGLRPRIHAEHGFVRSIDMREVDGLVEIDLQHWRSTLARLAQ